MNKKLISIIVPVYNVELYIDHCVESLVNQTYKNLEILLVDDGSPDKSGARCDEWEKKDSRIKVIHTSNRGAGAARNLALEIARGEYIAFVDSDDCVATNMYETLTDIFEKDESIDIVECEYVLFENSVDFFAIQAGASYEISEYKTEEALEEHIKDHYFRQLIWNKLYKRQVVEQIRFPEKTKIDDEFWTYQVLGNAKKLVHINKKLYAYRQQENSIMHLLTPDKRIQDVRAKAERHRYINTKFKQLNDLSLLSLWFAGIYQMQYIKRNYEAEDVKEISYVIKNILNMHPIKIENLKKLTLKEKIWLVFAKISLEGTCWLRNKLEIGL